MHGSLDDVGLVSIGHQINCVCVCVCVCEREREREREGFCSSVQKYGVKEGKALSKF